MKSPSPLRNCSKCGKRRQTLPKRTVCKPCRQEYEKDYRTKNKKKVDTRKELWRRKKKYGLEQECYDKLRELQEMLCAICKDLKKLEIDHCHKTGKVRGLLCGECNRALGLLKDDIASLKRAAKYLQRASIAHDK